MEGTSKADIRRLFGSNVLAADRTYVREVIGSSVLGYLARAVRERDPRPLRAAAFVAGSVLVTTWAYFTRLARTGLLLPWPSAGIARKSDAASRHH